MAKLIQRVYPDLCRWPGVRERWLIDGVDGVNGLISIHRHEGRGYATPEQRCTKCRIAVGVPPGVELDLDFTAT